MNGDAAHSVGLVWTYVGLQVAQVIVVVFNPAAPIWAKIAIATMTLVFLVYFIRARRWAWWIAVVLTSLGLVLDFARVVSGTDNRSPALVAYSVSTGTAGLVLLAMPSMRAHFRRWRRASAAIQPEQG